VTTSDIASQDLLANDGLHIAILPPKSLEEMSQLWFLGHSHLLCSPAQDKGIGKEYVETGMNQR
jgi:hypothetical protein